jgi:hypothetical protein
MKKEIINEVAGSFIEEIVWDNSLNLDEKSKLIEKFRENRKVKGTLLIVCFNDFIEEDSIILNEIGRRSRFEGVILNFNKLDVDNLNINTNLKDSIKNYISFQKNK